jgi:hypothetical protein
MQDWCDARLGANNDELPSPDPAHSAMEDLIHIVGIGKHKVLVLKTDQDSRQVSQPTI